MQNITCEVQQVCKQMMNENNHIFFREMIL